MSNVTIVTWIQDLSGEVLIRCNAKHDVAKVLQPPEGAPFQFALPRERAKGGGIRKAGQAMPGQHNATNLNCSRFPCWLPRGFLVQVLFPRQLIDDLVHAGRLNFGQARIYRKAGRGRNERT